MHAARKEYLLKWTPSARRTWGTLEQLVELGAQAMWEHFESTCLKAEVSVARGPRGFGIELVGNCIVNIDDASPARRSGQLQVRDVVLALNGVVLADQSLAELITPGTEQLVLSILRPGPPYMNPQLQQQMP